MKQKFIFKILIVSLLFFLGVSQCMYIVKAENITEKSMKMADALISGNNVEDYDLNGDNLFNVVDIAIQSSEYNKIDIYYIKKNYNEIVNDEEKDDFQKMGINILSNDAFVIDKNGVNIYDFVRATDGLTLEFIEGDNAFEILDNKLMFKGEAPVLAKVRLKNNYAESEEFYVYGTNDKEMSSYLYDYLIYLSKN